MAPIVVLLSWRLYNPSTVFIRDMTSGNWRECNSNTQAARLIDISVEAAHGVTCLGSQQTNRPTDWYHLMTYLQLHVGRRFRRQCLTLGHNTPKVDGKTLGCNNTDVRHVPPLDSRLLHMTYEEVDIGKKASHHVSVTRNHGKAPSNPQQSLSHFDRWTRQMLSTSCI